MLVMFLTLLRPHYLAIRNKFLRAKRSSRGLKREMLLIAIAAIIMICIYVAFHLLLRGLSREPSIVAIVPRKMLDMVYGYFFLLTAISSTVAAMGNIYSSETAQLILQAPVSSFKFYTAKFIETFLETSFMFFVLTTPAAVAYVNQLHISWLFLPAAFFLSLVFLLIPVGFGIAIATLFAQIIAYLWRRGGLLLAGILIAFLGAASQLARELERVQETNGGAKAFAGMVGLYSRRNPLWLPSRWVSDCLGYFLTGTGEGFTEKIILLISAVVISFSFGFIVFDLFSMRVRSSAHVHIASKGEGRFRGKADLTRRILEQLSRLLPSGSYTKAIILKDLSSLVRDRAQALQLLLYLGLGALYVTIYSFLSSAMALTHTAKQLWIVLLATSDVLLVGFMTTTILTRLVYPSVSLEGRAFWIIQVTPIRVRDLVKAKLICWLPFTVTLASSLMLIGALAIGLEWWLALLILVIGISLSFGMTGVSIGLGARYASFDWDSPSQLAIGLGTLTLLLTSISLVILFSVPTGILLLLLVVTPVQGIIGTSLSFFLMSACLWTILFGSIALTTRSIASGSRALEERLKADGI